MEYIQILLYVLFFILGTALTYIFFKDKLYTKLETKYNNLRKEKIPIDKKKYDTLHDKCVKYKKENDSLKNNIDRLKSYLGLVKDNEYGIIRRDLVYGDSDKELKVTAEFKTIQRGTNQVKISLNVDTIKTVPNEMNDKQLMDNIKKFIDDWYDIDDKDITWVIPDKAVQREFDIDEILKE